MRVRTLLAIALLIACCATAALTPQASADPNGQRHPRGIPGGPPDGSTCQTGGPWNQYGKYWGGICQEKIGLLVKCVDDKYGGDGLGYVTVNEWGGICEDDTTGGPMFAPVGSQGSSHSWFDAQYHALGVGMRSMVYTNEKVEFDYKNHIGLNPGGPCLSKDDSRGTELLTYVARTPPPQYQHVEALSNPLANDDVLHSISGGGGTAPAFTISTGDGDGGRIIGQTTSCAGGVTVEKYVMNPDSTDVQNLTYDYWSGLIGISGSRTFVDNSNPGNCLGVSGCFWGGASPTPGPTPSTNPNGDPANPLPAYDNTVVGAFSCYDVMYSDVSGLTYNRGQSNITWNGSYELDTTYPTGMPWDWNNSFPGLLKAELDWANAMRKPASTSPASRCNDGSMWQIWSNGFANPGGTIANDTNDTWAWNESCDGDQMGGNLFQSNEGTATNMIGASEENAWYDNGTNLPYPGEWAINVNCATDVQAESYQAFVEVGGHPGLHDITYDGYDMSTLITPAITLSSSPQTVAVAGGVTGNDGINGNAIGQKDVALMVVDATNGNEIVMDAGQAGTSTLKAIFTKNHGAGVVLRTLSPESARITTAALSYMVQQDGKTVVQSSWWNTSQGNSFANHYDMGAYAEEMFHGQWLRTAPYFVGNPVYTELTVQANSGTSTLTFNADAGPTIANALCLSNCWNGTRDMTVGQVLNLFDPGTPSHLESVTVATITPPNTITINGTLANTHAIGAVLRGTQAFDGCQKLPDGTYAADNSTTGGIGYYAVGGTCGEDGVTGGSNPHRPGGGYCREAKNGTYLANGPVFNWAVCINTTNKAIPINTLYSGGGCTANCLTNSYAHYCGALVLNGNAVDDSCLGRNPPVNSTGTLNFVTTSNTAVTVTGLNTITPASMAGISNGETMVYDPTGAHPETLVISNVTGSTFQATFAFTHSTGVFLEGVIFTPGSMNGVRVGGLYLLDATPNLETVCVASTTSTTATFGTQVSGGNCSAGFFGFVHSGTVPLTSASGTIQLDGVTNPDGGYDGGGGTICGYGGPYNNAGNNPSPAPQSSFSTSNCPALTSSSSSDSSDSLAPGTGVFFFQ